MDWFVSYDLRFCSFGYVYTVFSDPVNSHRSWICHNMNSNGTELEHYESFTHRTLCYRPFSFTWPAPISTPTGLVWDTNMVAVSLFWNTNMAAVTSCENALLFAKGVWCTQFQSSFLNVYLSLSGFKSSPLPICYRDGPNGCLHCTKVHHESYPTSFSLISLMLSSQNMHTEL